MRRINITFGDVISCNFGVQGMTAMRSQLMAICCVVGSGKVCSDVLLLFCSLERASVGFLLFLFIWFSFCGT